MVRSNRLPFLARRPRHALALAASALAAATPAHAGVIVQRTSFGFGGVLAGVPLGPVGSSTIARRCPDCPRTCSTTSS